MIEAYTDPDGSNEGWVPTADGAFVVNEPVGAMSWFPNNNVPFDKARYDMHRHRARRRTTVFGNGRLVAQETSGTQSTWHWREDSPMATYLDDRDERASSAADVERARRRAVRVRVRAGDAADDAHDGPALGRVRRRSSPARYGVPYPFTSSGGVVDTVDRRLRAREPDAPDVLARRRA